MAKLQKKSIDGIDEYRAILKRYWGYREFRPRQEEIIRAAANGEDTLALLPTGGGKTVTFQVPVLAGEGICLVVTPLIALMKDQVDQLRKRGIKAAAIHAGMTREEIGTILDNCLFGDFKFLYVSPERLKTDLFRAKVKEMKVALIAVDEAHCISQWGYDFRPSYLEINEIRKILEGVPVLALTATATPEVCDDIQAQLRFKHTHIIKTGFDRPNLTYVVRTTGDKERELKHILGRLDGSGIVYVRSRNRCRVIAEMLQAEGIRAGYYHAGLTQQVRDKRQQEWSENLLRVMVATNAFGMGIDKPDVRYVIHTDLPDTPESYYQEAGRAGRDGQQSWAILLYNSADKGKAERRIDVNFPGIPMIRQVYLALCNFLQIPLGSGKGQSYDFETGEFLHRYRLNAMVVHSAISVLTREGYIALTEAFMNPSRIMFRTGRDELYHFQVRHAELDGFIKLLLRSYSGLFSQYVYLDEAFLARRSGLPVEQVFKFLSSLSSKQIIHYIPRKDVPVITFLEERLDEKNLLISPERYQFRKERFVVRIREMIRYASSRSVCRNQFLLSYFGQLDSGRCGRCDVCLSGNAPDPASDSFRTARKLIGEKVGEGPVDLEGLISDCGVDPQTGIAVLEWMVEMGEVERGDDLKLRPGRNRPG